MSWLVWRHRRLFTLLLRNRPANVGLPFCNAYRQLSTRSALAACRSPPSAHCLAISATGSAPFARSLATAAHHPSSLIGQPTPMSHPDLLKEGEITPGITRLEYEQRRVNLVQAMVEGSVAVVAGFSLRYATSGIFHPFHQNTDLFYLTGFNEPDAALVIEKNAKHKNGFHSILFVRPKDPRNEVWDGPRCGLDAAISFFGADEAQPITTLPAYLASLLSGARPATEVYTDVPLTSNPNNPTFSSSPTGATAQQLQHAASPPAQPSWTPFASPPPQPSTSTLSLSKLLSKSAPPPRALHPLIAGLRAVKSDAEIAVMRDAGRITGRAFVEAMQASRPGVAEYELYAAVEYGVRRRGADGLAYVPVVAAGENALTLHYVMNKMRARDGDLVLVDAGGEYGGYASDVTRTWPVSGKFAKPQRELYEAVLRIQKECIKRCTESANVSLEDLQRLTVELARSECQRLFSRRVTGGELNVLYPHHVGHWLGLDVHDTPSVSRQTKLRRGHVVTIEPGLYIPNTPNYPAEYRGLGIRIEDDVAVGGTVATVLSVEAPKEVVDIEAACEGWVSPPRN
ncbi:xaa-pro dipeptidase app [Zopfochytrium polystomum]|nr:xaa-pro dipeptidase app [Zopfochytrium polystomum]